MWTTFSLSIIDEVCCFVHSIDTCLVFNQLWPLATYPEIVFTFQTSTSNQKLPWQQPAENVDCPCLKYHKQNLFSFDKWWLEWIYYRVWHRAQNPSNFRFSTSMITVFRALVARAWLNVNIIVPLIHFRVVSRNVWLI